MFGDRELVWKVEGKQTRQTTVMLSDETDIHGVEEDGEGLMGG